jgi:hypothetical protein
MSAVAKQIFDKINEQRKLNGYQLLVWNDKIAAGAELYAKEVSIGRYDHSPSDRFVENKIAYIMPGSVYYSLNVSKDMDIANYTVNSIFSSASLKNLVLLDDYDTAGIFVYCKEKACYSVIDMDQTKVNETFQLNKNSCTYREIYPSLLPYNQPVNMKITFNSTAVIDFYVLESKDYYVVCTPNHFVNESTYSKSFSTSLTAQKGYLLSFYARDGANITYTLEYEP